MHVRDVTMKISLGREGSREKGGCNLVSRIQTDTHDRGSVAATYDTTTTQTLEPSDPDARGQYLERRHTHICRLRPEEHTQCGTEATRNANRAPHATVTPQYAWRAGSMNYPGVGVRGW